MIRYGKMMVVAGVLAAFGAANEARAAFLVQVTATLNGPATTTPKSATDAALSTTTTTNGASHVTLSSLNNTPVDASLGTLDSPVHVSYATTTALSTNPTSTGDPFSMPYGWTLTFAHIVNGQVSGDTVGFGLTGKIEGTLAANGSTLQNTYLTGTPTPVSLVLDGQVIQISLDAWTPPGSTLGTALPNFSVSLSGGSGGFQPVPEPSTVALLGVGGLGLAGRALRRRLRRA